MDSTIDDVDPKIKAFVGRNFMDMHIVLEELSRKMEMVSQKLDNILPTVLGGSMCNVKGTTLTTAYKKTYSH